MGTVGPQEVVVGAVTGVQMVKKKGDTLATLQVPSGCGGLSVFAVCYRYTQTDARHACCFVAFPAACGRPVALGHLCSMCIASSSKQIYSMWYGVNVCLTSLAYLATLKRALGFIQASLNAYTLCHCKCCSWTNLPWWVGFGSQFSLQSGLQPHSASAVEVCHLNCKLLHVRRALLK